MYEMSGGDGEHAFGKTTHRSIDDATEVVKPRWRHVSRKVSKKVSIS